MRYLLQNFLITAVLWPCMLHAEPARDAAAIVKGAIDHWRGLSSYSEMSMTIHRPDWERTMRMVGWTLGDKRSLIRVVEPKQDAGNSTLLNDNQMWTYSPKINRIIKIPSSMMSQSWMGSDFSNKDIARSDEIVHQYHHKILDTENSDGHVVYVIESVPKEDAPVVWGKEVVKVRDDYVLISHAFYDQSMQLVKQMDTLKIEPMGGREVASWQRMRKIETEGEWTEVKVEKAQFDIEIPERIFTLSNLRNPRQ